MTRGLVFGTRSRGFSLIELLVSMVIGLVVTLAITSVLIRTEGSKRSTTSVNDLNQTGAYTAYLLDRAIRSAGSGYSQRWSDVYGCLLDATKGGTHVLPLPSAIPSASTFANVTLPLRLTPVIIGKGLANTTGVGAQVRGDVLIVMAGTGGAAESPQVVQPTSVTTSSLRLANGLGVGDGDLVLLTDPSVTGGCMVQQVGGGSPVKARTDAIQTIPLAGSYYASAGTNVQLTDFGASTIAMQLGSATNLPQFQLYGVGSNTSLFSYDLLQPGGSEAPIADGVVEMRALYGVDTGVVPNGILDAWVDPITGSGYEASVLTNGSAASMKKLRSIIAVKVGLILRTSLQERDYQVPGGTLTLFGGTVDGGGSSLTYTRTLTGTDLNYRYRTVEIVVPLRNVMLAPQS